jgi:ABC-type glutathione transport system ATPase component
MVNGGTAVLFVSHDMNLVRSMCDRVIWLEDGEIRAEGYPDVVVNAYVGELSEDNLSHLNECRGRVSSGRRHGSNEARISDIQFIDGRGAERYVYESGESLRVRIHYECREPVPSPVFGLAIFRKDGWHINGPNTQFAGSPIDAIDGRGYVDYEIASLPLLEGMYKLSASIYDQGLRHAYDAYEECVTFAVRNETVREEFGSVYFDATWAHHALGSGE